MGYDILEKAENHSLAGTPDSNTEKDRTEIIQDYIKCKEKKLNYEKGAKSFNPLNNIKKHKFNMKWGTDQENLYNCDQCNNF